MSIALFAWAMDTREPRQTTRLVLFVLAEAAQSHEFEFDDGEPHVWHDVCWPSIARIADRARASRRQVFEALRQLEQLGLMRTIPADVHQLRIGDRRVATSLRQLAPRAPFEFAALPCEQRGAESAPPGDGGGCGGPHGEGCGGPHPNHKKEPSGVETTSLPLNVRRDESERESASAVPGAGEQVPAADDTVVPASAPGARYLEPASPGAAAAPWLVLELARLMRCNDEKAKLPVALRDIAPIQPLPTADAARERLDVGHPSVKPWLDAMRLLIDRDGREPREVTQVLRWCQDDAFWQTNILSASTFREKYPKLRGPALKGRGGQPARQGTTREQLDALTRRKDG